MTRRKLIWQLYPYFLLVAIGALAAVAGICSYSFRGFYYDQVRGELDTLARVFAGQVAPLLEGRLSDVDALCKRLAEVSGRRTRFTVVLASGRVAGDSHEDPNTMDDHSGRPEIVDALKSGSGWSLRFSRTVGKEMMYVAVPVESGGRPVAVARASVAATAIDQALAGIRAKVFWGGIGVALCVAGLSLLAARRISRPIEQMEQVARRFTAGELDARMPGFGLVELAALARELNEMARQLHEKLLTITKQRNELQAVLSSMVEGVLAVDEDGRILSVNKAAAGLLEIDPEQAVNRSVEETVRNVDFQRFVKRTLAGAEPVEAEISLAGGRGRSFQLHGTRIAEPDGRQGGAVVVVHDVTQIQKLQQVRRDFVANVSHELRTPITSIKGFAETLLETGVENPEELRRYLEIIARHSDRLNAIIEDLLTLSRLEQDQQKSPVPLEQIPLEPVVASAVELTHLKASDKNITVDVDCRPDLAARANAALLEEALVNLLDNAVKYSPPGATVRVEVRQGPDATTISVTDTGCGIAARHLGRIFERFYVVDKGRSRELGGTGLGLAIVKHIAQVHQGRVTVQSTVGKGSTFTIHLPRA